MMVMKRRSVFFSAFGIVFSVGRLLSPVFVSSYDLSVAFPVTFIGAMMKIEKRHVAFKGDLSSK